ncbi:MAG: NADH-quinone oxidoreductase subunit N [Bacteroidales bacterium]|nr:NADH-quinone oxidoreductase subunit N [Bacteroidales bacterium]MCF8457285.1 NADH-quinone oxidoreductase subunit N [Bacteroidales bacterium]
MNLQSFLLMRHEIMLTLALVILLIAELSTENKKGIINLAILIFLVVTVVGFVPVPEGSLFGDMYRTSPLTVMMKNILNIGVLILFFQSAEWIKQPEYNNKVSEFYLLIISTLIGMSFMISSGHFLMFYIGLELATIPIAALAAYDRLKNISAEAGIKLILSSALSSGILLYGLSMLYGTIGSLYFTDMGEAFMNTPLQVMGFIFFFAGMGFKISLVPFHLWTADVYEGAPINVASYLSVISKGAAVFIFTIILFTVFHSIAPMWKNLLYVIAILTMTVGNLFALRQKNLKRFLAFSSIAQAGFILLGIIDGGELGMASVLYFVLIYIFTNLGAFGVVSAVSVASGKENMDDYNGLYHTNPKLSLLLMLALFSLAGIPPVAGFFGKFFLFTSAAHSGYYWLVFIAVVNATISLYYYLLVIKAMFINKNEEPIAFFKSGLTTRIGLLMCVAGIFIIGLLSPIFEILRSLSIGI